MLCVCCASSGGGALLRQEQGAAVLRVEDSADRKALNALIRESDQLGGSCGGNAGQVAQSLVPSDAVSIQDGVQFAAAADRCRACVCTVRVRAALGCSVWRPCMECVGFCTVVEMPQRQSHICC